MRVFHLVKGLGRGGAETLLVRTAGTELLDARRNGYGYFLPWKNALVPELREQGCVVRCFSAKNPLEMFLRLPELIVFLRTWRPDLIHSHLPLAGVVARLAGKVLGVPVVYTEHNLQERYHYLTRLANRLTWRLQTRVVAVSAEVHCSIARSLPSKTPVKIVLNGVDCERFSPRQDLRAKTRAELGLVEQDFLVGTVAVFRKQKRLDLWLDVARRLSLEFSDVHFLLVGDGPERPLVERLVSEYGLESRVRLLGLCADVLPYYTALDAFFMSSDFEGLPVALLEAMATGLPAVATAAGGVGEVIREPAEGLLAPVGDLDLLTTHFKRLYFDRELARELGVKGRQRVRESFSLARMNRELEEMYGEVLGKQVQPSRPKALDGYEFDRSVRGDEAMGLIRLALGEGSERSPRTLEFFQWKHRANPYGESYSLGARSSLNRQLAGLRLFQRWGLVRDDQKFRAVRAVDTGTHPDHQRQGIFTALTRTALSDLRDQNVDLVFNTPNKNSLPGYLKMGWEIAARIPVRARMLSRPWGKRENARRSFEQLFEIRGLGDVEDLVRASQVPGKLQIEKSLDYLKWRYAGHPAVQYFFAVRMQGGRPVALVVWCETSRYGLREFVLCELFAEAPEQGRLLLSKVLDGSRCHYAVAAFWGNPVVQRVVQEVAFRLVPFKSIELAVHPLTEHGKFSVFDKNWVFSTGDLQVF